MKKVMLLILVGLFLGFNALNASADVLVPGGYSNVDQSVMGARTSGEAFRTQVQIGTGARQHTAALDIASGAGRSMSNAVTVVDQISSGVSLKQNSLRKQRKQ